MSHFSSHLLCLRITCLLLIGKKNCPFNWNLQLPLLLDGKILAAAVDHISGATVVRLSPHVIPSYVLLIFVLD